MRHTHFYVYSPDEANQLKSWDPDLEPTRFASGVGHNIYELYARLKKLGFPVTAGKKVPTGASLVVAFAPYFSTNKLLWQAAPMRTMMIRSDWKLDDDVTFEPDLVVVPNRSTYWRERYGNRAQYVPALPQRGLVVRDSSRVGLTTAALKVNPENIPEHFADGSGAAALSLIGIDLQVDAPTKTNGSDQRWHDFSNVDVALCLRSARESASAVRKPPTKLINAWSANVIPLVAPEPAYLDLISPGTDAFVVSSLEETVETLARLRSNPRELAQVQEQIQARAEEFSQRRILESWIRLLEQESEAPKSVPSRLRQYGFVGASMVRRRLSSR